MSVRPLRVAYLLGLLALLAGCQTMSAVDRGLYTTADSVAAHDRVTGERTLNLTPRAKQIAQSNARSMKELHDYDASGKKRDAALDPDVYARLVRITQRILAVSHMRDEKWTIVLLDNDEFNAYTEGGTYIFVLSGLMKQMQDDSEVAAVLGHELGHVAANHVYEHMAHNELSALNRKHKKQSQGLQAAFTLGQEIEADRIGILYAALAGFDPYAASRVWARLYAAQGNYRGGYTDHPVNGDRAAQTKAVADKVKGYYIAGQQNPNFAAILQNNALWHKKKDVAAGQGGGFLAALDAAVNTYSTNTNARLEARRQQQLLNDLAALRGGLTIVNVQPADAHTVHLWFDYRGPNIPATETVYTLILQGADGAQQKIHGTLHGWMFGNRRYMLDFNAPELDTASLQEQRVFLSADDILR